MVSGSVTAPRLDLLNRDLVQTHVHAVWLAEAELNLGTTLTDVLVVSEDDLSLPLRDTVLQKLHSAPIRLKALQRARKLLERIGAELKEVPWYRDDWLDDVLARVPQRFNEACDRWRSLYRAAVQQRQHQNRVIGDHSRPPVDRDRAKRLRAQAESQISLLTNPQNAFEGDFYSYRYFASEGFLPGYNFPVLPLSAFIPARRGARTRRVSVATTFPGDLRVRPLRSFTTRAPAYRVHKVNLAFDEETREITQFTMKFCSSCGYGHLVTERPGPTSARIRIGRFCRLMRSGRWFGCRTSRPNGPTASRRTKKNGSGSGLKSRPLFGLPTGRPGRPSQVGGPGRRPTHRHHALRRCGHDLANQPRMAEAAESHRTRLSCSMSNAATGQPTRNSKKPTGKTRCPAGSSGSCPTWRIIATC